MQLKRQVKSTSIRKIIRERSKGLRVAKNVEFLLFIGYLKYVADLARESKLLAHDDRLRCPRTSHVRLAAVAENTSRN